MTKFLILVLALILLLPGCGTQVNLDTAPVEELDTSARIVNLADVEFVMVPDFNYYILLEEKMSADSTIFIRRYVKYDGFKNTVTEVVQDTQVPVREQSVEEAKAWIRKNEPTNLELLPQTFVSNSVQTQWQDTNYDASVEEPQLISLENLKRRGAISRLNEMFIIKTKPEEMVSLIEAVEKEFLTYYPNLRVDRKVEALPRSFTYEMKLTLFEQPLAHASRSLTTATIELTYLIDELGNPLELTYDASFEDHTPPAETRWLSDINQMGTFMMEMRDALIGQISLYGVTTHNPALTYANVTLNYESLETENYVTEKIFIR
ncbi:MAG: hypothetical protein NUK65_03475 [Firmicutes bacterium]|nr:hypothetical protein [Bacillota bacterium]